VGTPPGTTEGEWQVHEQYWEQVAKLDRDEAVRRTRCRYLAEHGSFAVLLLNREYLVDLGRQTVCLAAGARSAEYLEQLSILAYLIHARDLPLTGRLVSAEKLDRGGFFFRGSHKLPVEKLARVLGPDPTLLHKVGGALDAVPRTFGDAAIELSVLPRIPLTIIVWAADEEFPARASLLFDQSAPEQLPLDVLFAVSLLTIDVVVSIANTMS
jgi:hypothetical protein